ncbi:hypothetical protein LZP73_06325 [Shewanella sp. AS16]|uniref:DUF6641 family protein n=1 Tax=Shewanella sp. AS16 TaxID=2907625 RepID=UPI001F356D78|nr:DUF6641 family protein [Shewanella sp. AS16]MCE9685833.1 hypothetical protein [Shewanella sp. AS16]
MSNVLSSLKVVVRPEIAPKPPVLGKRMKMLDKLEMQLEMAECDVAGKPFEAFREKTVKDPETGERRTIRRKYNVRPWYYDCDGHYFLEIRVSGKVIELEKGKPTIDVGDQAKLPDTIKLIIDAVEKGELDEFILKAAKFPTKKAKAGAEAKSEAKSDTPAKVTTK